MSSTLLLIDHRRELRSQTSDNIRWKSRGGKSQRREEDKSKERLRRKKMQVRKKVLKRRVRSRVAR